MKREGWKSEKDYKDISSVIVKSGMPETCQMAMMFLYPLVTDSLSQVQSVHVLALNSSLFNLGSPFLFLRDYYNNLYSRPIGDHFGLFFCTIVHTLS